MTLQTHGDDLNVTFLNTSTKKAQSMIYRHFKSTKENIYQSYAKPSSAKVSAFNEIKKECSLVGGYALKMTGAGSDIFSCAYKVDTDTGTYLIYHTPSNRFAIKL